MQADMQRHKKIIPVTCKKMCDSGKTKTTLDVQMQPLWLYRFLLRCQPRCKQDGGPHCKRSCFETLQHGRRSGDFSQSRSSHRHNKLCGFPDWYLSGLSPHTHGPRACRRGQRVTSIIVKAPTPRVILFFRGQTFRF